MTTPTQTSSVSCYTESLELAVLLKKNEAIETLEQVLDDIRKELGAQKALADRLDIAFSKTKKIQRRTSVPRRKNHQKCLDNRNLVDLKDTISDLRTPVANQHADHRALPLLHQLLYHLTAPKFL